VGRVAAEVHAPRLVYGVGDDARAVYERANGGAGLLQLPQEDVGQRGDAARDVHEHKVARDDGARRPGQRRVAALCPVPRHPGSYI